MSMVDSLKKLINTSETVNSIFKSLPTNFHYYMVNSYKELAYDLTPGDLILDSNNILWITEIVYDHILYAHIRMYRVEDKASFKPITKSLFKYPVMIIPVQ